MCVSSETHDAPSRRFVETKQHKGKHAKRPTHQALSDVTAIASRRFAEFSAAPRGSGETSWGAHEMSSFGELKALKLLDGPAAEWVAHNTQQLSRSAVTLPQTRAPRRVAWDAAPLTVATFSARSIPERRAHRLVQL